jgi:L-alanine-DL-glutamate epimerase-like enolase superfamily enzyme
MKITAIDCHVLLIPAAREDATDSAQDNLVVFIHTDAGITGVGESDANPWMLKAAIEAPSTHTMGMGLKDMLMGADPLDDAEAIWERLYVGTAMNGRRGLIIHAMGALDMALWDIKGKAAGKPCWELLLEPGVSPPPHVVPYASLQPSGGSLEEYRNSLVAWATRAKELGFRAAKLEATLTGPYAHEGMNDPSPASVTSVVAAVRQAVGPDFTLMVAVQYAYEAAEPVAAMVAEWERRHLDVLFLETPLRMDNTEQIAALGALLAEKHCGTQLAYGEWQATRHEFDPNPNPNQACCSRTRAAWAG